MKRIFTNISYIFGILGIISAIIFIVAVILTGQNCFIANNIIMTVYFIFVSYFLLVNPYLGIILFLLSQKEKKSYIGLVLTILTIFIFHILTMYQNGMCYE